MNKNRPFKVLRWIFLTIFLLLNGLIIYEACIPGNESGKKSRWLSDIFANILNDNLTADKVEVFPTNITLKGDNKIVLGTTNAYTVELEPSNVNRKGVVFSCSNPAINVVQQGSICRIEALEKTTDDIVLVAKTENNLTSSISLNVVDREKPNVIKNATISSSTISVGTTAVLDVEIEGKNKKDFNTQLNYERYLDKSLIEYTTSDPSVATVKNGIIKGISSGEATIGIKDTNFTFDITVNNDPIITPTVLTVTDNITRYVYDLDYDSDTEIYHTKIEHNFVGDVTDKKVHYEVMNDVVCRVDNEGNVFGYKTQGETDIKVISNMDESVYSICHVSVVPASVTDMTFNDSYTVCESEQINLSPLSVLPLNAQNKNIKVEIVDSTIAKAIENGNSAIITGLKIGETDVVISSKSNPSVTKTIKLNVSKKEVISDAERNDFSGTVRKIAGHFSLFGLTAVFGFLTFYSFLNDKFKMWILCLMSAGVGFIVAGVSELIQLGVQDRTGSFQDVMIDFTGYVLGTLLSLGVYLLIKLIIKKKNKKKDGATK